MSLYSSIWMAGNTLRTNQIALQVAGQNISNANTPGYIREEVVLSPGATQEYGGLLLGMGVQVRAVVQKIDHFLEERLRSSVSDRADSDALEQTSSQLEGLINELGDTDLSTSLNDFFSSISEILNQPESVSVRNMAVLQGTTVAQNISRLARRVYEIRNDINRRIGQMAERINKLAEEIQTLNIRIAEAEGGDVSNSDAVGLRDQRMNALEELATMMEIRVEEQPSGGVTVYSGGDYLVFEGTIRKVKLTIESDHGQPAAEIRMAETDSPVDSASGELHGLTAARDEVLAGFIDKLDDFAQTLAFEFNRVFSGGQGLAGYQDLVSEFAVDDGDLPLNKAGLPYQPVNGSFQVMVYNRRTGLTQTHDVLVDLNGIGDDTTLDTLVRSLAAIDGISASATPDGKLALSSDSPEQDFAFANDTSGVLASLGLNVFFTGSSALDLAVHEEIRTDPAKFAVSQGGVGADTNNAIELAALLDRPVTSHNGDSLTVIYDRMVGQVAQGSAINRSVAEGNRVFEQTLRGQKLATSGVSIDEEAVKLIGFQRSFQAASKFIAVCNELLEMLVNI